MARIRQPSHPSGKKPVALQTETPSLRRSSRSSSRKSSSQSAELSPGSQKRQKLIPQPKRSSMDRKVRSLPVAKGTKGKMVATPSWEHGDIVFMSNRPDRGYFILAAIYTTRMVALPIRSARQRRYGNEHDQVRLDLVDDNDRENATSSTLMVDNISLDGWSPGNGAHVNVNAVNSIEYDEELELVADLTEPSRQLLCRRYRFVHGSVAFIRPVRDQSQFIETHLQGKRTALDPVEVVYHPDGGGKTCYPKSYIESDTSSEDADIHTGNGYVDTTGGPPGKVDGRTVTVDKNTLGTDHLFIQKPRAKFCRVILRAGQSPFWECGHTGKPNHDKDACGHVCCKFGSITAPKGFTQVNADFTPWSRTTRKAAGPSIVPQTGISGKHPPGYASSSKHVPDTRDESDDDEDERPAKKRKLLSKDGDDSEDESGRDYDTPTRPKGRAHFLPPAKRPPRAGHFTTGGKAFKKPIIQNAGRKSTSKPTAIKTYTGGSASKTPTTNGAVSSAQKRVPSSTSVSTGLKIHRPSISGKGLIFSSTVNGKKRKRSRQDEDEEDTAALNEVYSAQLYDDSDDPDGEVGDEVENSDHDEDVEESGEDDVDSLEDGEIEEAQAASYDYDGSAGEETDDEGIEMEY